MDTILLIPAYFPTIVQTAAMVQAKSVFLEYADNYQKQTYRNRLYIATANGRLGLNIPIKHSKNGKNHQKTAEVHLENNFPWQRQHWRSLQIAYRTSPFFEFYEDELYPVYHTQFDKLSTFNEACLDILQDVLQTEFSINFTTEYMAKPNQKDLRHLIDAKKNIAPELPQYNQVFQEKTGFIPNLTILDLLFNEGPNALNYLQQLKLNL